METTLIGISKYAEQLGIIGILVVVIAVCLWGIRHLYLHSKECEDARLEDAHERAEIREELGEMRGKMDTLTLLHQQNLASLAQHNNQQDPSK